MNDLGKIRMIWRLLISLKLALAFLTVIPIRLRANEATGADLAASRWAYPVIGAAIGLALAGLSRLLDHFNAAPGIAAFLILATGAALTGGLHLDGLADTADGLFLWGDRSRRLEVMRDPHVGSYGVIAVVLVILGKYTVLSHLAGSSRGWAVVGAATIGRTLILVGAGAGDYARPQGTGRILVDATTLHDAIVAALLILLVGILVAGRAGLVAALLTLALAWMLSRLASARLGGVTGDILGTLVETGELLVFLTLGLLS